MNYWTQPPTVVVEAAAARSTTSTARARCRGRRRSALGSRWPPDRFAGRGFVEWRRHRPVLGRRAGCGRVPGRRRRRTVDRPRWRYSHARGDPAAERRAVGPCRIGGGPRTGTRSRRSVPGHTGSAGQGRFRAGNRRRPWRSRRGASTRHDPRRSPPGRRGPGAGSGRTVAAHPILPSAATSAPSYPGRPPGPGLPPTGAPACAPHPPPRSTPPSRRPGRRAAPLPASANRRPAPPVPPRKPPPSGSPRVARPPRATGSSRWAVPCGPRSRSTAGGLPDRRHGRVRRRPLVPTARDQRRCAGVAAGRLMCRSTDTARPSYPTHRHRTAVSGWLGRR